MSLTRPRVGRYCGDFRFCDSYDFYYDLLVKHPWFIVVMKMCYDLQDYYEYDYQFYNKR